MHPTESWLYVMSANGEVRTGNMSGARTMMERGIRMSPKDERLWAEWIKLEMGYIQHLKEKGVEDSNEVIRGGIVEVIIEKAITGGGALFFIFLIFSETKIIISEIGKDNHAFIKTVADGISEYPLADDETRGRLVERVISIFQE